MMIILETIAVAFSMYSALPMPQFEWNERNMKYALCAFPLIGTVIALAEWCAELVCGMFRFPDILRGALMCILPVLLTGGIHLDGYMDTCDALASHAKPERKLEILKDPHIGSFAVIRVCCWFVLDFALWCAWDHADLMVLTGIFVLSRSLSGIAICTFPLAKNTGLAHLFAEAADKRKTVICLTVQAVFSMFFMIAGGQMPGTAGVFSALIIFVLYRHTSAEQFGGITGDLAGWFLQQAEIGMLVVYCIGHIVMR